MKPPATPTRFRAPVRYYHRHTDKPGTAWDVWLRSTRMIRIHGLKMLLALLFLAAGAGVWLLLK